ncbi:MAG: zinc-finger domain-containing protein [Bdellovibrionales bacterium]
MPFKPENIPVETTKVACSDDKDFGHPRVYLAMNAEDFVDCPYCGRRYVLKEGLSKDKEL